MLLEKIDFASSLFFFSCVCSFFSSLSYKPIKIRLRLCVVFPSILQSFVFKSTITIHFIIFFQQEKRRRIKIEKQKFVYMNNKYFSLLNRFCASQVQEKKEKKKKTKQLLFFFFFNFSIYYCWAKKKVKKKSFVFFSYSYDIAILLILSFRCCCCLLQSLI